MSGRTVAAECAEIKRTIDIGVKTPLEILHASGFESGWDVAGRPVH
jgi:hypothetical protein